MSERPTDPSSEDDLEPMPPEGGVPEGGAPNGAMADERLVPDDADAAEAFAADDPILGGIEDDEPTIEEGDAALQAAADEAPLSSVAAVAGVEEAATQTRPMRPSERRAMRAAMERGQVAIDPAHRVSDQASAFFVLLTVGVFVLVMLNGLLLGHGGLLSPKPTALAPVPSVTAVPSGSAGASPTAAPSTSPAPSPTITLAPSPTPS